VLPCLNSGFAHKSVRGNVPAKARGHDFLGRFREIISDPINLLIHRDPFAGCIQNGHVILHNGTLVPTSGKYAYYGDFSQILIINRGVHEPLEEYCFQEVLKSLEPAPVMLELGAYWGHYSMWCNKIFPGSQQYLVEPEPRHLEVAKRNFATNGLKGTFIEALVGHGKFTVDEFLEENKLPGLAILHSDIQGFELEMLCGAKRAFENKSIDYCFISTHSDDLHTSCLNWLNERRYEVTVEANWGSRSTSYDGFLLAVSPKLKPVLKGFGFHGREEITLLNSANVAEFLASAL
jgi:hypothetical protein